MSALPHVHSKIRAVEIQQVPDVHQDLLRIVGHQYAKALHAIFNPGQNRSIQICLLDGTHVGSEASLHAHLVGLPHKERQQIVNNLRAILMRYQPRAEKRPKHAYGAYEGF